MPAFQAVEPSFNRDPQSKLQHIGADIGSMARPFLLKAHESEEALDAFIADTLTELRICMFGAGAADLKALRGTLAGG